MTREVTRVKKESTKNYDVYNKHFE